MQYKKRLLVTLISSQDHHSLYFNGLFSAFQAYIVMCINQCCRDPSVFPNPEVFLPERWKRGSDIRVKNAFALLPFGFGTRSCIGQRFAEQEIQVCIAKVQGLAMQNRESTKGYLRWICVQLFGVELSILKITDKLLWIRWNYYWLFDQTKILYYLQPHNQLTLNIYFPKELGCFPYT